jgi:hypothetical protein
VKGGHFGLVWAQVTDIVVAVVPVNRICLAVHIKSVALVVPVVGQFGGNVFGGNGSQLLCKGGNPHVYMTPANLLTSIQPTMPDLVRPC